MMNTLLTMLLPELPEGPRVLNELQHKLTLSSECSLNKCAVAKNSNADRNSEI